MYVPFHSFINTAKRDNVWPKTYRNVVVFASPLEAVGQGQVVVGCENKWEQLQNTRSSSKTWFTGVGIVDYALLASSGEEYNDIEEEAGSPLVCEKCSTPDVSTAVVELHPTPTGIHWRGFILEVVTFGANSYTGIIKKRGKRKCMGNE